MALDLIAVGSQMPGWVQSAFTDYTKRLPKHLKFRLKEIPVAKRHKNTVVSKCLEKEGKLILGALPDHAYVILLDEAGQTWNSENLAKQLLAWQQQSSVSLIIGGPDGYHNSVKQRANVLWSLSSLTLPHPVVRVIVAEQIYRAWTINQGHPYHRA